MIDRLIHALRERKDDIGWRDAADAIWLAAVLLERLRSEAAPPASQEPGQGPDLTIPGGRDGEEAVGPEPEPQPQSKPEASSEERSAPILPRPLASPDERGDAKTPGLGEGSDDGRAVLGQLNQGAASPVSVPGAAALADALAIGRHMRPLVVRVPTSSNRELDEERMIRNAADLNLWFPVLRPTSGLAFEMALVVDAALSMAPWREAIREFRRVLEYLGAFRDVRAWRLRPDRGGLLTVTPESGGRRSNRPAAELRDPSGRRLVLIVSDCVAAPWHDGRARALIADWGRTQPVAVVQVLPQSLWRQTGLSRASRITARAPHVAAPNARLRGGPGDPDPAGGVIVPVLTMAPGPLGAWARMLTRPGLAETRAYLLGPQRSPRPTEPSLTAVSTVPEPSAEQRIGRFVRSASRPAQELAACLAAAPLHLPVMRLVQHAMLPESRPTHLAEVLLGGLVRVERAPTDDSDDVSYEYHDGVRSRLIDLIEFPRAVEAFEVASRYVAERFGHSLDFRALVENPRGLLPLDADDRLRPFARVAAQLLRRLGREYEDVIKSPTPPSVPVGPTEIFVLITPRPAIQLGIRREAEIGPHLDWSPDGNHLALRDGAGGLIVVATAQVASEISVVHTQPQSYSYKFDPGPSMAWSPDARWLAYGSLGRLFFYGVAENRLVEVRDPFPRLVFGALAWSRDGLDLALSEEGYGRTLKVISLADDRPGPGRRGGSSRLLLEDSNWAGPLAVNERTDRVATVRCLAWSPDDRYLAVAFEDGTMRLWHRASHSWKDLEKQPTGSIGNDHSLAWWPDGRHFAAVDGRGGFTVWDVCRRNVVRRIDDPGPTAALAVSADGRLVAARTFAGAIELYRCDTWERVPTASGQARPDMSAIGPGTALFHPTDPGVLATFCESDEALRIWDFRLTGEVGPPSFVPFPPAVPPPQVHTYRGTIESLRPAPKPTEPRWNPPQEAELIAKLTATSDRPIAIGLIGKRGMGKTPLALNVAHHPSVRRAFPDGTIWLASDENSDLVAILEFLSKDLGFEIPERSSGITPEGLMDMFAQALAGRRYLLVVDEANDDALARLCLRIKAPATLLVLETSYEDLFVDLEGPGGPRDAIFGEADVVRLGPPETPLPAEVPPAERRLLLFAHEPAGFDVEAAAAVLGITSAEARSFLDSLTALTPHVRPVRGFQGLYELAASFRDEQRQPPPADDPAYARFVAHYRGRITPISRTGTSLFPGSLIPQVLRAIEYAQQQPRHQLPLALWVLESDDERDTRVLASLADRGVQAADTLEDRPALARIAAAVRKAGLEALWTGPQRDRLAALGLLGPAAETLISAMKLEDDRARALANGSFTEAADLSRRVASIRRRALGDHHPETLRAQIDEGEAERLAGRLDVAEAVLRESLLIRTDLYGPDHLETARGYAELAAVLRRTDRLHEAESLSQQALEIRRKHLGGKHPEIARSLAGLGAVLRRQARFVEAKPLMDQALEIRLEAFGMEHHETARSLAGLAALMENVGDYDQAIHLWRQARQVRQKVLGPSHWETRMAERGQLRSSKRRDVGVARPGARSLWRTATGRIEGPMTIERVDAYLETNRARFEEQLKAILRIPSVSAQPDHDAYTRRAAEFLLDDLRAMGFPLAELVETKGHPLVYAESLEAQGRPTVLIYGHYDVQPPEPLEHWHSPPFEPTVVDGDIVARGATDNKGQLFTHLKAAEAWLKAGGGLPVNVKFLIEGEEEVGGANLVAFVRANRSKLACDHAVISDTSQFAPGIPAITYGLKGLAYFELTVTGAKSDVHSGMYGGTVANPLNALCSILAGLKDADNRITIEGFYDPVRPLEARERAEFSKLPFSEAEFRKQTGAPSLEGEIGYTTLERCWARPTYDVNGIFGGYQGPGPKTVLPRKAGAKLSFRLVPDQDPAQVAEQFKAHVAKVTPPGVKVEVIVHHGAPAVLVGVDSPGIRAASRAIEAGFGKPPVFVREGGSIPVVSLLKENLGVDTLLLGWGQNDDNPHGPNEKFSLADYHRGIKSSAHLLAELVGTDRTNNVSPHRSH